MEKWISRARRRLHTIRRKRPTTQGDEGIQAVGHRAYVGGLWKQMGQLQFKYLVSNGLQPHHYLLDIACGSLRAGIHFISYLETGHYLGIDKEEGLIRAGIEEELGQELYKQKKPQLVVSSSFEFEKFDAKPDYSLAQSLFTHLPPPMIHECFKKLRKVTLENGVFYATFFEFSQQVTNPSEPDDHGQFLYTRQEMEEFGTQNGWEAEYIGNWNHPRGQVMVRYRPA